MHLYKYDTSGHVYQYIRREVFGRQCILCEIRWLVEIRHLLLRGGGGCSFLYFRFRYYIAP